MKRTHCLSSLEWQVRGWTPHTWQMPGSLETGSSQLPEIPAVPATVPGSVQAALRAVGVLPDWNIGLNARQCEWVENRHWSFETEIPAEWLGQENESVSLHCLGLDYSGTVLLNGVVAGRFQGSFTPHVFDLSGLRADGENRLAIVLECPPRWLGQVGWTSQMTAWKPRFNYTWDWTSRLVQIGVWDDVFLAVTDGESLGELRCRAAVEEEAQEEQAGRLELRGTVFGRNGGTVRVQLEGDTGVVFAAVVSAEEFSQGISFGDLPVALWQPNGRGRQPLYSLHCFLQGMDGEILDEAQRRVGFRQLSWQPCEAAPADAAPWLCVVNSQPLFLQGVNWTPIRPNFADVTPEEYRQRLELYRDLGCNLLRVWGGAFLEKQCFYDLCDELGLLVWQELPLSSSGIENWPPEDEDSLAALTEIAGSYIQRRGHHVSLALWCGGNELQGSYDGEKHGIGKPIDLTHPLMARLQTLFAAEDPGRRFLPTSSSGPHFMASAANFGRGVHWDVHGPWKPEGLLTEGWSRYWADDDALFRSETGAPGAGPADLIRATLGGLMELPATADNPLWRRSFGWLDWAEFSSEQGRPPADLDEYVAWSQARQAVALTIAAAACRQRFPRCGGILIWMGHDSFPCAANTSIVDFWGRPKPAALALREIFTGNFGKETR